MIIIIPNKSVRFVKKHSCPNVCIKAGASICLQEYKYTGREKSDPTTTATTYSSIACPPNEKYNLILKDKTVFGRLERNMLVKLTHVLP